jgi:hypothetical protein
MLQLVIALTWINEILIEHFVGRPLEKQAPNLSRWWLMYVALVTGGVMSWFCEANLFAGAEDVPAMLGRVLTAVIVGGGSQLLHKVLEAGLDLVRNAAMKSRHY